MINKNDFKYIFKRVVTALFIALTFFMINKCTAKADTTHIYLQDTSTSGNQDLFLNQLPNNLSTFISMPSPYIPNSTNFFRSTYRSNLSSSQRPTLGKYLIFYNSNLNLYYYFYMQINENNFNNNYPNIDWNKIKFTTHDTSLGGNYAYDLWFYNTSINDYQLISGYTFNSFVVSSNDNLDLSNYYNSSYYSLRKTTQNGVTYYTTQITNGIYDYMTFHSLSIFENSTLIKSSFTDVKINNTDKIVDDSYFNVYTKIDLTGYQALLLTPKNYQDMIDYSSHEEFTTPSDLPRIYLDLKFYTQYCTNSLLVNIENSENIILNNTLPVGSFQFGSCPTEPLFNSISYEFDSYTGYKPYNGILVYNQEYDTSLDNPYKTSYVFYDSSLYNYTLIEDLNSFDTSIEFDDVFGEHQNIQVEKLPSFDEVSEQAFDTYDEETKFQIYKQKLSYLLEFVKFPFEFLNKINNSKCKPISMSVPHIGNLTLPCMSSIYDNFIPSILKNIIIILVNGLIFYRVSIKNLDIITDLLNPNDDKLEVVDL